MGGRWIREALIGAGAGHAATRVMEQASTSSTTDRARNLGGGRWTGRRLPGEDQPAGAPPGRPGGRHRHVRLRRRGGQRRARPDASATPTAVAWVTHLRALAAHLVYGVTLGSLL